MRKWFIILCIVLIASPIHAGMKLIGGGLGGVTAAAPVCDQVQTPTEDAASTGSYSIGYDATNLYRATKFVYIGTTGEICGVDTWMDYQGSNSHTYTLAFYSHDAGEDDPNAVIANGASVAQDLSGIGSSEVVVSWTFATNPTLTNGTTYWVVIYTGTHDTTHRARWHYNASGTTERIDMDDDGSGTWTNNSGAATFKFKLYSY